MRRIGNQYCPWFDGAAQNFDSLPEEHAQSTTADIAIVSFSGFDATASEVVSLPLPPSITTVAAMSSQSGVRVQLVAAIEGYPFLLTDGDPTIVPQSWNEVAYGDTDWTDCIGGLFVDWKMQQDIKPWDTTMTVGSVVLNVVDCDGTDQLGIDVHGAKAGSATYLSTATNANYPSIGVKSTSPISSPVYIGTERVTFSATSGGNLLTGCQRGTMAPFKALSQSGSRYSHNHLLPDANNIRHAQVQTDVATAPRTWLGRWVGIWLHVNVGGAINIRTDAQLLFAGQITSARDNSDGSTIIECVEARQSIADTVLLRDQYVGKVQEGVYLFTGQTFTATDAVSGTGKVSTLTVVSGAPASSFEVQTGIYSLDELAGVLNLWLSAAKSASSLNFNWSFQSQIQTGAGTRSNFHWEHTAATSGKQVSFRASMAYLMQFIGFGYTFGLSLTDDTHTAWDYVSPEEPYRILPTTSGGSTAIFVEHTGGTWIDNTKYLPQSVQPLSAQQWGVVKLSTGDILLGYQDGTLTMTSGKTVDRIIVAQSPGLNGLGNSAVDSLVNKGVRASQGDVQIDVSQLAILEGTFADLLTRFIVSTGVANYNDVTYDTLPAQLGAAIPGALLDSPWINSITALDAAMTARGLLVVLDKPTNLWDVFKFDLIARRAHMVWKDGSIQMTTWSTPTTTTAVWDFEESNKAVATGVNDNQRVPTELTDEFIAPIIKLSYNRLPDGTYRDSITIVDPSAMSDTASNGPVVTLQMRNSFAGWVNTGQTVEQLAADIASWIPLLSRPLRRLKRTLGIEHICQLAPGDQAAVNDNFARDPSTGLRGLVGKPGLILATSWDLGGPNPSGGETRAFSADCDLLLLPTDRIAVYSPCAEVDSGAAGAGYNAGTKVLTFLAHAHSLSSEVADATRFAVNDAVRVVEIDPSNPAAPLTWTDVIAGQSGNTVTLTTGLAMYDTSKKYRMFANHFGADTATQKAKVFQGSSTTNLIESVETAFQYGYAASNSPSSWPAETPSTPPALYSQYDYGDGYPLHPGSERDAVRLINNLVNYRTATLSPVLSTSTYTASYSTSIIRVILGNPFPKYFGLGIYAPLYTRKLYISPFARNTHASSHTLTVTLSRFYPQGTDTKITSTSNPEYTFVGPYVQATFTLAGGAGWAALTAQALDVRVADQLDNGTLWITVEGTGDTSGLSTNGIEFRGFSDLHLGPLVLA